MPWYAMALSIMATQASAITFISTTGQSYIDGMRFVQFYFGLPDRDGDHLARQPCRYSIAPRSTRRTNIWKSASTRKTRALASVIFLSQRGVSAGLTHLRAGDRAVGDFGLAGSRDHAASWASRWSSTRAGRHQGGDVVRRAADVLIIFSGLIAGAGHGDRAAAADVRFGDAVYLAGAAGQAERGDHALRLEQTATTCGAG